MRFQSQMTFLLYNIVNHTIWIRQQRKYVVWNRRKNRRRNYTEWTRIILYWLFLILFIFRIRISDSEDNKESISLTRVCVFVYLLFFFYKPITWWIEWFICTHDMYQLEIGHRWSIKMVIFQTSQKKC